MITKILSWYFRKEINRINTLLRYSPIAVIPHPFCNCMFPLSFDLLNWTLKRMGYQLEKDKRTYMEGCYMCDVYSIKRGAK